MRLLHVVPAHKGEIFALKNRKNTPLFGPTEECQLEGMEDALEIVGQPPSMIASGGREEPPLDGSSVARPYHPFAKRRTPFLFM